MSYVFLFLSLFPLAAATAAGELEKGHRESSAVLLRVARNREEPARTAETDLAGDAETPATTTAQPTTTDIAKARVREAFDISWNTAGKATEARAATSKLRSRINQLGADVSSKDAIAGGTEGTAVFMPAAAGSEAKAKANLQKALDNEKEVQAVLAQVDQKAFQAAQKAAIEEVAKLEKESKDYFKALMDKFKALADPGPPTAADAAAKAAQPYIDTELRVAALVQYYNEKATLELTAAQSLVAGAKSIANTACWEQKVGVVDMAQRHMMQAHMMIGTANLKKAGAYNIRKLVESLNMSIPSYQRAAQMAANHALATFSGLQTEKGKEHVEAQRKVFETTKKVDDAFAALDTSMAEVSKILDGFPLDS